MHTIEVSHIAKRFGATCAVEDISFAVERGEIFGLLGPNGAGKSTLIRMLTTLLPPTSGNARINGFDLIREANKVRNNIGVIPQAMTSDLDLTAAENMHIFAKLYKVPKERRSQVIPELLEAVDLLPWAGKPVKNFSGGMRRRLEIARGLVHEPRIFFLDEPTTGLDPVSRISVWEMLVKLKKEWDLTILMTTHYMDEADKLCDRIAIINHGRLIACDTTEALLARLDSKEILFILGSDLAAVPEALAPWQADKANARITTKKKTRLIINNHSRVRVNWLIVPVCGYLQAVC